jgi:hypothetical protein
VYKQPDRCAPPLSALTPREDAMYSSPGGMENACDFSDNDNDNKCQKRTCYSTGSEDGSSEPDEDVLGEWDDAEDDMYKARLESWRAKRGTVRVADIVPGQAPGAAAPAAGGGNAAAGTEAGAAAAPAQQDVMADVAFDGGFNVPGSIYHRLFDYQKTGKGPLLLMCPARHRNLIHSLTSDKRGMPMAHMAVHGRVWIAIVMLRGS